MLTSGTRLGPEIQSLIGSSGMGEVYKARDTRLGRTVAIKVLSPQLNRGSGLSSIRRLTEYAHRTASQNADVASSDRDGRRRYVERLIESSSHNGIPGRQGASLCALRIRRRYRR